MARRAAVDDALQQLADLSACDVADRLAAQRRPHVDIESAFRFLVVTRAHALRGMTIEITIDHRRERVPLPGLFGLLYGLPLGDGVNTSPRGLHAGAGQI